MSPQEIYKRFLLKVNKNDTNFNIKVPKGQFVLLFNEQQRLWYGDIIKKNESSDYIEDIEELLVVDKLLSRVHTSSFKDEFSLPTDFGKRVSSYVIAKKGDCEAVMVNWLKKPKDIPYILQNSNHKPSFEYQETIGVLNSGKITIYKEHFDIKKAYLTYYKEPRDIDIEGYKKLDGTASVNINSEISDGNTDDVINLTVAEVIRNFESPEQLQLALQRLNKQ